MSRKEAIEQKLSVLNPHFLEVIDESDKHLGHSGNPSGAGDTHFIVKIAAEKLNSMNKIVQHRTINNLLAEEFANGLHALSIKIVEMK
ncbi:BolA family transcriptional regulator [Rickettsiaceae bacterium]|nr:BolA family transcriptional regulator [Rickettsiaceae bacterium]